MATISAIRTAVKTTLEAAIATVKCYDKAEAVNAIPHGGAAVVVLPAAGQPVAMGRGTARVQFRLLVMVVPSDDVVAQDQLDGFISGGGSTSIETALFNSTLGLTGVNANVTGWDSYGARFESAGIPHIGVVVNLSVLNPGT